MTLLIYFSFHGPIDRLRDNRVKKGLTDVTRTETCRPLFRETPQRLSHVL